MIDFKLTTLALSMAISVFWIAGVFFSESLDGQLTHELGEVFAIVDAKLKDVAKAIPNNSAAAKSSAQADSDSRAN